MKKGSIIAVAITGVAVLMMASAVNMPLKSRAGAIGKTNSVNSYCRVASVAGPYMAINFYAEK